MKITKISLHQPVGLLRLVTDEGLEGHCTGVTALDTVMGADVDLAAPILVGTNPLDRERTWRAMRDLDEGPSPAFRAGIDVALWDLSAKIAGRPLFRHLGGFRDRVPVCRVGTGGDSSSAAGASGLEIVKEAKDAQRAGFKAYRFGVMADENAVVHLVREVRAAVGPDFPLILDGRARCMVDEAVRIGRVLDEKDYFYFDCPRPRNDHSGGKQVAGEIDTPTSAEVCSPIEASQVMTAQSADHIRTCARSAGGITDVLKAARCGGVRRVLPPGRCRDQRRLCPYSSRGRAIRNTPFLEMTGHEVAPPFVLNPLQIEDGFVHLPDQPGLGMEIDMDAVMDMTSELIEA